MAIFLTGELARTLASQGTSEATGCLEYGRYTGEVRDDGTVAVYAWVNSTARRIGTMTRDGRHGMSVQAGQVVGPCVCEQWRCPNPVTEGIGLAQWLKHAGVAR